MFCCFRGDEFTDGLELFPNGWVTQTLIVALALATSSPPKRQIQFKLPQHLHLNCLFFSSPRGGFFSSFNCPTSTREFLDKLFLAVEMLVPRPKKRKEKVGCHAHEHCERRLGKQEFVPDELNGCQDARSLSLSLGSSRRCRWHCDVFDLFQPQKRSLSHYIEHTSLR